MLSLPLLTGPHDHSVVASVVVLVVVPLGEPRRAVPQRGDLLPPATVSTTRVIITDTLMGPTWQVRCRLARTARVPTVHGDAHHPMAKAVDRLRRSCNKLLIAVSSSLAMEVNFLLPSSPLTVRLQIIHLLGTQRTWPVPTRPLSHNPSIYRMMLGIWSS